MFWFDCCHLAAKLAYYHSNKEKWDLNEFEYNSNQSRLDILHIFDSELFLLIRYITFKNRFLTTKYPFEIMVSCWKFTKVLGWFQSFGQGGASWRAKRAENFWCQPLIYNCINRGLTYRGGFSVLVRGVADSEPKFLATPLQGGANN